jgi:uncharacterized protein (TIGR03032 family)
MRFARDLHVSPEVMNWFSETECTLVLNFRNEPALVFLSPGGEGQFRSTAQRIQNLRRLHVDHKRVIVATDYQIHELVNVLPASATYDGYDHIYILRRTHTTGSIGVRDLDGNAPGDPYFVSDRYGAVGTLSDAYSFEVRWQPSSSGQHVSEASFHPTGVARDVQGEVCYATVINEGASNDGTSMIMGAVVDVDSDIVVTEGAFAPVNPQFYEGDLCVTDALNGALLRVKEAGKTEVMVRLPMVPSSLYLHEGMAFAAISGSDRKDYQSSSPAETHTASDPKLLVIDLTTGTLVGEIQWPSEIGLPTDVEILPGARRPMALGPTAADLPLTVVFEAEGGIVYHRISPEKEDPRPSAQGAIDDNLSSQNIPENLDVPNEPVQAARVTEGQDYSFFHGRLEAHEFLTRFEPLVPERFRRRIQAGAVDPSTPLLGVGVSLGKRLVGVAAASIPDDSGASHAYALGVLPPHRGQALGTELLERLENRVHKAGARVLECNFRASISSLPALERLLEKRNWEPPEVKRYLYKGKRSRVPESFLEELPRKPARGTLFEWADLTVNERNDIAARLASSSESAIPESLSPFQLGVEPDLECSVGLRHDDRVVGWMITHRIREDLLQYTTLYVEPDLRGPGVGPTLLAEAIRRHKQRTDIPRFIWMVDGEKDRVRQFVDLRLSEVVDARDKLLVAGKRLDGSQIRIS